MATVLYSDSEFITPGEQKTATKLRDLPRDWIVVCNKLLPRPSREIDFVVIGDNSVIAIDEKSWQGNIVGSDINWQRTNGDSERSPLNKIDMVSKQLAGYIRRYANGMRDASTFVQGAISLTLQENQPQIRDPRSPDFVFLFDSLIDRIKKVDQTIGVPLVGLNRDQIRKTVFDLVDRPKIPKQVNEYTIQDGYDLPGGARTCRATHSSGNERLLTIFARSPDDEETNNLYLQEFRTLQQLETLDICPRFENYFRWSDDFIVVPCFVPNGPSLGSIPLPQGSENLIAELKIFKSLFAALALMHERGVIHRALSPQNIYVETLDADPKVILTGFYAARRPNPEGNSISPHLDTLTIDDPFKAPELLFGYGYADDSSDTYAATLILLERLTGIPAETMIAESASPDQFITQVEHVDAPEHAIKALIGFLVRNLSNEPPIPQEDSGRMSAAQGVSAMSEIITLMS